MIKNFVNWFFSPSKKLNNEYHIDFYSKLIELEQRIKVLEEENYYPEEYKGSTVSSVSNVMPPWGHSDMEALKYTDEELNAMCEKAASDEEKKKCREYNLREAEYYDKRAKLDTEHYKHSEHYYDYTRNDSKRQNPFNKVDKVKKWLLPIEPDPNST